MRLGMVAVEEEEENESMYENTWPADEDKGACEPNVTQSK